MSMPCPDRIAIATAPRPEPTSEADAVQDNRPMTLPLSGRGGARRLSALAVTVGVLGASALSTASVASASQSAATTTSSTATATRATTSATAMRSDGARWYAAVTTKGATQSLSIVNRSTGAVVKTLATAKVGPDEDHFTDVDLTADGTVYTVQSRGSGFYGTALVRYSPGKRPVTLRPYVTSVEASPDGRTLAVTVLSPDGDRDGKGLEALRILSTDGRTLRTLTTLPFPVGRDGLPQVETRGLAVYGWLGSTSVIVRSGCCAESDVSVVSTSKATPLNRWATFVSEEDAMAIGVKGSSVLVAAPRWVESYGTWSRVGIDAVWMSAARPKGTVAQQLTGESLSTADVADRLNARFGATPLFVSPKRFPYKGPGTVVRAAV